MNLTGIVSAYVSLAKSLAGMAIARADTPSGKSEPAPQSSAMPAGNAAMRQAGTPVAGAESAATSSTLPLVEGEDAALVGGQAIAGSGITGESDTPLPDIRRQSRAADHTNTASRSLIGLRQPASPPATQPLATALLAAVTSRAALPLNLPAHAQQPNAGMIGAVSDNAVDDQPDSTAVPPREAFAGKAMPRPAAAGLGQSDIDDGEPDVGQNDEAPHPAPTPTAARPGAPLRNPLQAPYPTPLPASDELDIAPEEPATGETQEAGPDTPATANPPIGRRNQPAPDAARATGGATAVAARDALQGATLSASAGVDDPPEATAADDHMRDSQGAHHPSGGTGVRVAGQPRSTAEIAMAPADTGTEARPDVTPRRDTPVASSDSASQTPLHPAAEAARESRTRAPDARPQTALSQPAQAQPARADTATVAGARTSEAVDQRPAPTPEAAAPAVPEHNQRATAMRLELPQHAITEAMGGEQPATNPAMEAVILNAAMIPGWPAPRPFEMPQRIAQQLQRRATAAGQAEEPENTLKRGNRDEVAVQTYLANMGVKRSLLDRFRAMLKPVNQRMKILFGLAVLATQVVFTLHTVLSELESIESEEDEVEGQPGEQQRRLRG